MKDESIMLGFLATAAAAGALIFMSYHNVNAISNDYEKYLSMNVMMQSGVKTVVQTALYDDEGNQLDNQVCKSGEINIYASDREIRLKGCFKECGEKQYCIPISAEQNSKIAAIVIDGKGKRARTVISVLENSPDEPQVPKNGLQHVYTTVN